MTVRLAPAGRSSPAAATSDSTIPQPVESRLRFTEHARARRAARLCELAVYLPPEERALILATYADGKTGPQVATLIGATRQSVHRRLTRLRRRLLAPEFAAIAPRLHTLDPALQGIAQLCVIEGCSVRTAAARLKMTQHAVRELRLALQVIAGVPGARPTPRS